MSCRNQINMGRSAPETEATTRQAYFTRLTLPYSIKEVLEKVPKNPVPYRSSLTLHNADFDIFNHGNGQNKTFKLYHYSDETRKRILDQSFSGNLDSVKLKMNTKLFSLIDEEIIPRVERTEYSLTRVYFTYTPDRESFLALSKSPKDGQTRLESRLRPKDNSFDAVRAWLETLNPSEARDLAFT